MEVHLTVEMQKGLQELSARCGRSADELVQDAVAVFLADDESYRQGVLEAMAQIARGEYIDHDEMEAGLEQMLKL